MQLFENYRACSSSLWTKCYQFFEIILIYFNCLDNIFLAKYFYIITAKLEQNRDPKLIEDELVEFYSGDATALGDDESVGYLIKLTNQVVMRNLDAELQPYDLTAPQWVPLLVISKGRADTVAGCAREIGVDTGAMTRMLDRLEAKGFVVRNRSAEDRRVVNVALTKAGHEIDPTHHLSCAQPAFAGIQ